MIQFISSNFSLIKDILLVLTGFSAMALYVYQERKKVSEAASLITNQIEELHSRLNEISSYIDDQNIDFASFYSSQPIFRTNYWDQNKHYFIREIDPFSFNAIEEFYKCASQALEQQEFMKNLQKTGFFHLQQAIVGMESQILLQLTNQIKAVDKNTHTDTQAIEKQISDEFLFMKNLLIRRFNDDKIDTYIPMQISVTLKRITKDYYSSPVLSCSGFARMKKISKRKL